MKRVIIALLAVLFAVSTTAVVYANCGKGGCCAKSEKKEGCPKADPNSK